MSYTAHQALMVCRACLPHLKNPVVGHVLHEHERMSLVHASLEVAYSTKEFLASTLYTLPLKIYLVEDSLVIRESLIATLEELVPVRVVGTAEDEKTAVHWLSQPANQCDLVIVDIFLKTGSGLGVLRVAKDIAKSRALVVLSNYATPDMARKCLALGADMVFDKSNDIEDLIEYCSKLAAAADNPPA